MAGRARGRRQRVLPAGGAAPAASVRPSVRQSDGAADREDRAGRETGRVCAACCERVLLGCSCPYCAMHAPAAEITVEGAG